MSPRLPKKLVQLPFSVGAFTPQVAAQNAIPTRTFGIRSLNPPKHSRYNEGPDLPVLSQPLQQPWSVKPIHYRLAPVQSRSKRG